MHFPRLAHMETILSLQGWGHSCRHHYVWNPEIPRLLLRFSRRPGQPCPLGLSLCPVSRNVQALTCLLHCFIACYLQNVKRKEKGWDDGKRVSYQAPPTSVYRDLCDTTQYSSPEFYPTPTLPRSKRKMKSYVLKETLKPSCPEVIFCRNHTHESLCLCLGDWAPPYGDRL